MENIQRNRYDQVPYLETSHSLTHPDVLATIGTLLDLRPADVRNCRVLELGCANGSNLIPMALGLPESLFIGLDNSERQIISGQQAINNLGLKNINLKSMNILDIGADMGQFDYIIVHGIFSWVPDKVKDKILSICARNLSPEGIAYISYNTYPGWYLRKVLRDVMLYHTRKIDQPEIKIDRARSFLNYIATSAETVAKQFADKQADYPLRDIYAGILKRGNESLREHSDTYLFHEELEDTNDPIYFYQFAEWAGLHGLQYLSEASLNTVFMNEIPAEIRNNLVGMTEDIIELEQYRDFLTNRAFRSTILVHQKQKISRKINPDRLSNLFAGSRCQPVASNPDICTRSIEQFVSPTETLSTDHPVTKAALVHLGKIWPKIIKIEDLLEAAYERLFKLSVCEGTPMPENPEIRIQDLQILKANLLKGFVASPLLVELHVYSPVLTTSISRYPLASPWARLQVANYAERVKSQKEDNRDKISVTNLRHERVELQEVTAYLLHNLDGTCDREELLTRLRKCVEEGTLVIPKSRENQDDKSEPHNQEMVQQYLESNLQADLQWLAWTGLLIS